MVSSSEYRDVIGIRDVRVLSGYLVRVTFTDGTERDLDLEPHLWGPVFEPIRNNRKLFASVFIDPIGKTLAWPNDVDLAPETLYYGDTPPPWAHAKSTRKQRTSRKSIAPQGKRPTRRAVSRAAKKRLPEK